MAALKDEKGLIFVIKVVISKRASVRMPFNDLFLTISRNALQKVLGAQ